jgi:peroxiredoxin
MASELITVETLAPDFSLIAANGEQVNLSSYRNTKNVVLYSCVNSPDSGANNMPPS